MLVGSVAGVESDVGLAAGVVAKMGVGAVLEHTTKAATTPEESNSNIDLIP